MTFFSTHFHKYGGFVKLLLLSIHHSFARNSLYLYQHILSFVQDNPRLNSYWTTGVLQTVTWTDCESFTYIGNQFRILITVEIARTNLGISDWFGR